jgi:hypothetical protein
MFTSICRKRTDAPAPRAALARRLVSLRPRRGAAPRRRMRLARPHLHVPLLGPTRRIASRVRHLPRSSTNGLLVGFILAAAWFGEVDPAAWAQGGPRAIAIIENAIRALHPTHLADLFWAWFWAPKRFILLHDLLMIVLIGLGLGFVTRLVPIRRRAASAPEE